MIEHLVVLAGLFTLAGIGFRTLYWPDLRTPRAEPNE